MRLPTIPFQVTRIGHINKIKFDIQKTVRYLSTVEGQFNEAIREADEYLRACESSGSESEIIEASEIRNELINLREDLREIGNRLVDIYSTLIIKSR